MLLQLLLNGLINGAILSVVALGYSLVYNTTKIFHVAYAALYMIAPFFLFTCLNYFGLNLYLAGLIGIVATILISIMIELLIYKPFNNIQNSLNVMLISSIGVMTIVTNLIVILYGNESKVINAGISETVSLNNLIFTRMQIAQLLISLIAIGLFLVFLKTTKFGIKTRAMRDDAELCKILGINIPQLRIKLFALSGLFAAVGGILVAFDVGMDPYIGMPMLLNAIVALIIGGIGKFHAPILGGFIIGILQSLAMYFFSSNWQDALTFTLLILFLFFRPQGILGEKERVV